MKRTNHQMVVALLAASIDATKSLKKEIGMKHHILLLAVLLSGLLPAGTQAADAPLVQDPNFPLIRLPAEFDSHRTNILLITSEDNGAHLGCYGDPYVRTPHLDKLAGQGVRFANAYVTQAGCSQSRASIFTGLYPHQNGQIGLATHGLRMYRGDTPNIFSELKRAGYTTGIIGKIHVNPKSAFPLDYHHPMGGFSHRDVAKEANCARAFMQQADKPFLLMVNYKDAHRPFIRQQEGRPARPLEPGNVDVLPQVGLDTPNLRKQTAGYYNCMMRLDDGIGMLMQAVKDAGKWDNTLVVYLGDHGADILRGKRTSYEGGVKIPLIASWPGCATGGQVRTELVSTIDLMPTFLELAGVAVPPGLPGRSLAPLLRGDSPAWRTHLFTEYHLHSGDNYYPQRTVRDGRYKLIHNLLAGELNPGYAFTNDRFFEKGEIERVLAKAPPHVRAAYARLKNAPPYELYDLENDPWEFHDLAADPACGDILNRLKEDLLSWRKRTEDPLLDPANLARLTGEVAARWTSGSYKKNMHWEYPEYFFRAARTPQRAVPRRRRHERLDINAEGSRRQGPYPEHRAPGEAGRVVRERADGVAPLLPEPRGHHARQTPVHHRHLQQRAVVAAAHAPRGVPADGVSRARVHGRRGGKDLSPHGGEQPPDQWDGFQRLVFRDDPWFRGNTLNYPWKSSVTSREDTWNECNKTPW